MHGIRDEGEWLPQLEQLIEKETDADAKALDVNRISLTRFLLAGRFLGYVKKYKDDASDLLATYTNADVIFIAHSYGTWCLRDLLNKWPYKNYTLPKAIFVCGSILPKNCPWGQIHSKIFKDTVKRANYRGCGTTSAVAILSRCLLVWLVRDTEIPVSTGSRMQHQN